MTALHETTAPLPSGVINQMTAACLPAGCLHLTAAVSEADQRSILAALDLDAVDSTTTEGVRVPLPNGPPQAAVAAARSAFKKAAAADAALYGELVEAPLLAQCVAYGIKGSMAPHVDASVTRSKPLVVLSFGLDCVFRAGAAKLRLRSGDAVLLDAATTLHGVDAIIAGTAAQNVRVSLMFYAAPPACERGDDGALDGAAALFDDDSDDAEDDYAVLLFYKYARWRDRDAFRAAQEATCRSLNLCGRLRIAEDGLNGTLGGPRTALEAYIQETRRQAAGQGVAMDDVDWKWGAADAARPLAVQKLRNLSVKACREVVAFSDCGGVDQQAIDAPPARKVDAAEFHSVLESGGAGVVLVDVRNVYERRVGRFEAPGVRDADLKLRQFSDLPRALDDGALDSAKTILMYCTGGVRCERASAYLRSRGVAGDLCQLAGGIHRYQERYGNGGFFRGRCYVFDPRMAVGAPGEASPDIVGACRRCGRAWDAYGDERCDRCRMRLLVCDSCDGDGLACELCDT